MLKLFSPLRRGVKTPSFVEISRRNLCTSAVKVLLLMHHKNFVSTQTINRQELSLSFFTNNVFALKKPVLEKFAAKNCYDMLKKRRRKNLAVREKNA